MKRWKYYTLTDPNKEAVGTLYAEDINEAYAIACRMKQLPLAEFEKLFGVEKL
jgi:hypothetical protein